MDQARNRGFVRRITGAIALDVSLYEEVENDPDAIWQAIAVVVAASFFQTLGVTGIGGGLSGFVGAFVLDFFGWFAWAGITYLIGTRVLPVAETSATWGELLRATGFSAAPGLFAVLIPLSSVILLLNLILYAIIVLWTLIAFVIAVRQALDYTSTWRAVFVCVISWPVFFVLSVLL